MSTIPTAAADTIRMWATTYTPPTPDPSPALAPTAWIAALADTLDEGTRAAAAATATQATNLATQARLHPDATQAVTDAIWLGAWGNQQDAAYAATGHSIAARRAWRNQAPMAASLLAHASYLPHMPHLAGPDQTLLADRPTPEGWDDPDQWQAAADIYTLTTTLREGRQGWSTADQVAADTRARYGRRATMTAAVAAVVADLPAIQARLRERIEGARWDGVIHP